MGQRDTCTCSSGERIQNTSNQQTEIYNRKEHTQGSQQEHYRHTEQSKKSVREIDSIYQTRPSKESHNSSTIEGTPPNHTSRCDGNGHGNQGRGTSNNMECSHSINSSNYVHQNTVGRVSITAIYRSGNTGQVRNPDIHPPTSQMLQMSKIQPYLQHLPCKKRHLRPLRRPSQNKDMCRQAELTPGSKVKMQQLQRGTLHDKWKMPLSQGDYEPKEASTTSGTITPTEAASEIGLVHKTTVYETPNTHEQQTSNKQVPPTAIHTFNGRLPRHTPSYRQQDNQNHDANQTNTYTTYPVRFHAGKTNSTEEKTAFRRLETDYKKASQSATESPNKATSSKRAYRTASSRTTTFHKWTITHHQSTGTTHQTNEQRTPDVSQGYCSNQPINNDNAATPNGTDGTDPAERIYSQHNEGHSTE